ncbi:hypothetical protein HU200_028734 [Digitaria exilis]|uniref:Uncharacterized protein n=1 Tax=Digitaria exilis TaxID=1010633 RepID=A0A835ESS3_9POAL|nr:hypothetical protein HU200_028734 [Digitaria exilis]
MLIHLLGEAPGRSVKTRASNIPLVLINIVLLVILAHQSFPHR